jgi:hypothetical protein
MKTKLFITAMALFAISAGAAAQDGSSAPAKQKGANNGVCDNYEAHKNDGATCCKGNGKGQGKGNCDGTGKGQGKGQKSK